MNKRNTALVGSLVAIVLFFAVNVLANTSLRRVKLDLTEEKLFTLADGSRNIARKLEEPIRLYFFLSEDPVREIPAVKDYSDRVRAILAEYVDYSGGNLILEEIDPEPFSDAEDRAVAEGIAGIPLPTGDTLYFGLVATNATDDREVMPYFDFQKQDKERFLEYDLSRMIYRLAHPTKNKVAVLSSLPIAGTPGNPMMGQPSQQPRWKVLDQLGSFYDLSTVEPQATEIPPDIDVLVVIHPKELSDATLFAIDQYVLGGGRLVAFVDPHCAIDNTSVDPSNPMSQFGASRASNLNRVFTEWGFEMVSNKVLGDRRLGIRYPIQTRDGGIAERPIVFLVDLKDDAISSEDAITSPLSLLRLESAGILRQLPAGDEETAPETTFEAILASSDDAMEIDAGSLQFRADPEGLLAAFVPAYESFALAARISGPARTAFPEGAPEDPLAPEEPPTDEEDAASDATFLKESVGPIQVIVAADVDMLADRLWIREQSLGPFQLAPTKVTDNADFLVNAIENLLGSEDLISIRARGKFSRPFDRVEEIRRDAEQRYLSKQQEIERTITDAQRKINELQTERDPNSTALLSSEQEEAIKQANLDLRDAQKKMRDVQHDLQKDIEHLGSRLKLLNIGLIPAVVSFGALALGAWRVRRRGKK